MCAQTARSDTERAALIHREILQLVVLVAFAVAAFFVTKGVAASNRDMSFRDAAEWYGRGRRELASGDIDAAIDAFRRASVRNRHDKQYVLALGRALARKRDYDAARGALMSLRDAAPEDPEVNLDLARLATARQDVTEALRFYRNALYAPWPMDQADARRAVRMELIRFLLAHAQTDRALSELLVLSTEMPDDVAHHVELGRLFASAGDHRHALDQFERGLRLDADDEDALAGAGDAAFKLGEYAVAQRYLQRAPDDVGDVKSNREIVGLVLSRDPLAARIGSTERRRRLTVNFEYARQRLDACVAQQTGVITSEEEALHAEVQAFDDLLDEPSNLDQDTIETGVELIDRIEIRVLQRCGSAAAVDRALILIGRQHTIESS